MPQTPWRAIYQQDLRATGLLDAPLSIRIKDRRFRFYRSLRMAEYYTDSRRGLFGRLLGKLLRFRHDLLCQRYGWTIPIHVFGPGLAIVHVGTIVVSGDAKIGKNCRLNVCTNIGRAETSAGIGAPVLGDNVYLGPGAKLFGPIVIGDDTAIGANAVVNRSFPEGHCTLAGVPARVVSDKGSERFILS